jgi:peroxiredoxin
VQALADQGLGLAAISYDSTETQAAFAAQHGISYTLLSDEGSATIRRYGILNTVAEMAVGPDRDDPEVAAAVRLYVSEVGASQRMVGMAFPGTFMLDREGRVTARYFEDSYIERNTVQNVLLTVINGTTKVAGARVSTDHLQATSYPGDAAVAPGNRFGLVLDVAPRPRMHVYAPGAEAMGYRVIRLAIDPQPEFRTLELIYPDSEIYHFEPLDERVPVFQQPFTIVQEMTLNGSREAQAALRGRGALTITGTLEYQACDDAICFNPVSLPLSWTVTLRPVVFERTVRP